MAGKAAPVSRKESGERPATTRGDQLGRSYDINQGQVAKACCYLGTVQETCMIGPGKEKGKGGR